MLRKRALRGVAALILVLGLFTAAGAQAAEAPPNGLAGFWTTVEAWFQDLASDWLGLAPAAAPSKTDPEEPLPEFPEELPTGPWTQDGGSDGGSTTDGGPVTDPDG